MSRWIGPCCLVSYKRMEDKDVMPDRTLLISFLQKNGGEGCHVGQDLIPGFLQKNGGQGCHLGQDLVG